MTETQETREKRLIYWYHKDRLMHMMFCHRKDSRSSLELYELTLYARGMRPSARKNLYYNHAVTRGEGGHLEVIGGHPEGMASASTRPHQALVCESWSRERNDRKLETLVLACLE